MEDIVKKMNALNEGTMMETLGIEYLEVKELARDVSKLIEQNTCNLNRIKLEQIVSIINDENI